MTRAFRITRNIGIALLGLVVVLVVGTLIVVQTDWFRNYVRQQIITATEDGTGGRVEIGSFQFSPRSLEAIVNDFVIHGKEPAGAAPFVRAARVQVNLRLFTSLRRLVDISFLGIEKPGVNVMIFADGSTNIPEPKDKKPKTDKTVLDTLVDLAVDYFRITDGVLAFDSRTQQINLSGRNLRADLGYNLLTQTYKGKLSMQPLYAVRGTNTPVVFTVDLPVVIDRKHIGFENAKISTPASVLTINGGIEDLNNPRTTVRVNGKLALSDLKALGDLPLDLQAKNVPTSVDVDGNAFIADDRITVNGLRLTAGQSTVEASGNLRDPQGNGSLQFKAQLALDEVGRLANVAAKPGGVLVANGTASLDKANNYHVTGNVEGRGLSFVQGTQRIRDVNFKTAVDLDPKRVDLKGLNLSAFGGQFTGDASMEDFAQYKLNGTLRNFDLQTAARVMGQKLPYDGVVSGPVEASGDLKSTKSKLTTANARLSITPGRRGIPVSGKLNAQYNGATGNINVADSYIQLPNTRLNLSGSLNDKLNLDLNTANLNDLLAAALPAGEKPPVTLDGGRAHFTGSVTGGLSAPRVSGHLAVTNFSVQGRKFDSLDADINASKSRATVENALLRRGQMQMTAAAAVGLQNWSPKPNQALTATAAVRNGDLADVMVLAGQPPAGYSGALSADANIGGTVGNPTGQATINLANGTLKDQPFDRMQARVNLSDQLITIPGATLTSGPAQVTLTAEFQHPRDSMTTGRLHAHVQSNQVELAQVRELQKQRPNTSGLLNLNADVVGNLSETKNAKGEKETEFLLSAVNADASARNLRFDNQTYGDVNAKAWTTGQTVNYDVASNFAGSDIKVNGNTQLVRDYPTTATATMKNLPVERLLAVARKTDIPARGNLSGTAQFKGTMKNPEGSADIELTKAVVYEEPLDRVRLKVTYLAQRVDVPLFEVVAGPSRLDLTAQYDHPVDNLQQGELRFRVNSNTIDLARIRNIQKLRPGLGGALRVDASGAAAVREGATPPVLFRDLNANIGATGISANGNKFGDLTLKAATTGGRVAFNLDSDLANAAIHGKGDAQLSGDYPLNAELTFSNVLWSKLQPLLGPQGAEPPQFEAATDGALTVSGPVLKTEQLRGTLRLARVQVNTVPRPGPNARSITIRNQGPVVASLDRGVVRVDSAHLTGPQTDINLTGTAGVLDARKALDLNLNASTNLSLLESFSRDIYASGNIVAGGTVRGTLDKPLVNGKLELQNASLNHVSISNGISNANGQVIFNGNTATIRNLTGQSGGGKVTLSGFVTMAETIRLGVRANLQGVRVRTQQGVSVVASAFVNLTGTTARSLASGVVTIDRITYAPQSDLGSILTRSGPPVQSVSAPNPLLDNMNLDVRIRTAASTSVQASLADNIQLSADLRLRGTANSPSLLGRVQVTEGDLVFFGSKYRVSSGTVSFYNPTRIEPVLDMTLETQAKGVNVVLNVTGPIDNMKLNYTSDPPLQFQEIVGLLATGKAPTSDPTLLANQPSQPQQSFTQMGETALVSKAIADPVASRLERVFGVSQLKIDPTFTSGSDLPQARVTLQQQVATNLTFTYVSSLQDPNAQIVRIEWSINPQWSAIANRDENGILSVNFMFKKQFR